jgi:hypothetical protein
MQQGPNQPRPPTRAAGVATGSMIAVALGVLQSGCDLRGYAAVGPEPFSCDDASWSAAKVDPRRFIAHAGGSIDGRRYTNSREAIDLAYDQGFRLIELDLIETRDGQLVAAHDWEAWREAAGSTVAVPSRQEFKASLLHGSYHTMDLADVDRWFAARPDAFLVTDKVTDFARLVDGFSHLDRLIVEVFSVADFHRALRAGVRYPMLSLRAALANDGEDEIVSLLRSEPVKFVAVASRMVQRQRRLLAGLRRNQACSYVFTSSDGQYLESVFDRLVFGAYTDDWDLRSGSCGADACETY